MFLDSGEPTRIGNRSARVAEIFAHDACQPLALPQPVRPLTLCEERLGKPSKLQERGQIGLGPSTVSIGTVLYLPGP